MSLRTIDTSQGAIAIVEVPGRGAPLVMVHGNSSCKEVFHRQLDRMRAIGRPAIALDLPGHGGSDPAADPKTAYTLPGYADVVAQVARACDLDRPVLLGWSLGGHIALELLATGFETRGVMVVGAPPTPPGVIGMARGFRFGFDLLLASKAALTDREAIRFVRACLGHKADAHHLEMVRRADRKARPILSNSMMRGEGHDHRATVAHSPIPVAVVNGVHEPFARLDYIASLAYANLFDGRAHVIDGVGHAPFLQAPDAFNRILERFMDHAETVELPHDESERLTA